MLFGLCDLFKCILVCCIYTVYGIYYIIYDISSYNKTYSILFYLSKLIPTNHPTTHPPNHTQGADPGCCVRNQRPRAGGRARGGGHVPERGDHGRFKV
jgi:hypothetical protein